MLQALFQSRKDQCVPTSCSGWHWGDAGSLQEAQTTSVSDLFKVSRGSTEGARLALLEDFWWLVVGRFCCDVQDSDLIDVIGECREAECNNCRTHFKIHRIYL